MVGTVLNKAAINAVVVAVGIMETLQGSSEVAGGGHLGIK